MTAKPTVNQRFAGFFALAALACANMRAVQLALADLAGDVHPVTGIDTMLGIWGTFVLLVNAVITASVCLGIVVLLTVKTLQWILWAVTDGNIPRPGWW
jgi:hypothetical protein